MAGKEFPLSIIIRTVDRSTAALRAIGKKFDGLGKKMESVGKKAAKIGKSLTRSLTLPIVAVGAASVKAFADFEQGMASVSTLVDTSTESMDMMGKKVLEIGRRTPVALDKLTGALFDIRSAGIPAADAMNVLERSAKLGVAGLGTTAQAARLVAGAINAWGLEGEAANRIYNTVFQTTKNGITTIEGLEKGFGAVAGKMAAAGIEVDDYFASVAALTTTTLKAAGAHTQMRAAVDGLQASNKRTSKIWRKLGVKDFNELLKKSGGVTEAFRAVARAAGDQSGALKKLIGSSEGEAAVIALISKQGDKQLATLKDMRKETEGLTDDQIAFNKQNKTSAAQWQRTKNSLTSAAISMGTLLAPALTKVAEKIQSAAKWFDDLDDSTKSTIAKIAGVTAVVGPMLIALGKVAPGVGIIISALAKLAVIAKAHPMFALAAAIGAVAAFTQSSAFKDFGKIEHKATGAAAEAELELIESGENRRAKAKRALAKLSEPIVDEELRPLGVPRAAVPALPAPKKDPTIFDQLGSAGLQSALGPPALYKGPTAAQWGAGAQSAQATGGTSKIEIDIRSDSQNVTVKTVSDEREIDVNVGNQMVGEL